MTPWTLLDTTVVPGDGGEMRLYQRGTEYSIRVGSYELMNSRLHGSEIALATVVFERLPAKKDVRILVGGLGMGFTLTAVLQQATPASTVVVAELVPAVVEWHRGPLFEVSKGVLDDPRVTVRENDVAVVMHKEQGAFDAILLDVDNGPAGLTSKANDRIYSANGLREAGSALRPNGILAVWSAGPDEKFARRLQQSGFTVEELRVRGRTKNSGPRHVIWLARRV
jgi:spermidine synthase